VTKNLNHLVDLIRLGSVSKAFWVSCLVLVSTAIEICLLYVIANLFNQTPTCLPLTQICVTGQSYLEGVLFLVVVRTVVTMSMNYSIFRFSIRYVHLLALAGARSLSSTMNFEMSENEKLHVLYNESDQVVNNLIHPFLLLIRDIISVGGALLYIAIRFPSESALFGAVFLTGIAVYTYFIGVVLKKWGPIRQELDEQRLKSMQEISQLHKFFAPTVQGENFLVRQLDYIGSRFFNLVSKYMFLRSTNRYVFEFLIFFLVAYGLSLGNEGQLAFLASLGVVSLRAMPALSNLVSFVNTFQFHLPALSKVWDIVFRKREQTVSVLDDAHNNEIIEKQWLRLNFGENQLFGSREIGLPKNGLIVISGSSGSGKTTLLKNVAGHENTLPLKVSIFSEKEEHRNLENLISYCPQQPQIVSGSLRDNIFLFCNNTQNVEASLEELASTFCLEESLLSRTELSANTLSGGQKKRIGLARAFALNKPVYLLDEPTSELDNNTAQVLIRALVKKSRSALIMVSTHDEKIIQQSEEVICLD
jgi:putative ABC transport system ATP-binding protein